jgi:thymidylate synthase (FAD)
MEVQVIDFMGSDLTVVNAARVSFEKESEAEYWEYLDLGQTSGDLVAVLNEKDQKLIKYLAKHNHWTPFGHPQVTFRIKAPIFVARQLGKHQVGMVWNEVSRRYVDSKPEFYRPSSYRLRADNVKQGSSDETTAWINNDYYDTCTYEYEMMIEEGICPEQARMVLPQSMYTKFFWTGSLAAWMRVINLRLDSHTQQETREVAEQIAGHIKTLFPVSYEALINV